MNVVVVESPAKARTINKYLGEGYVVLASYGHVRDLPAKDGSVKPDENFVMTYETDPKSAKHLADIAKALKSAEHLYLATDPDREGEAISWHVLQALEEKRAIKGVAVKRVVFNEVTRGAVLDAMRHPRDLDMNLINAQQARRALDYLVGFTLSPVLWRKLPGARSAGRVQSVALRLVCERETEIERFKPREYWTIEVVFLADGKKFTARLVSLDGKKLEKFDLADRASAEAAARRIAESAFHIAEVQTKPVRRHPAPPFTTSTLQQEASRKLGFSAKQTMQIAQRLYEGVDIAGERAGIITYMRTDGVQIADEALAAARDVIAIQYGTDYLPPQPRVYKATAKNAQEAHEAIRPTNLARLPDQVTGHLDPAQAKLYDLIWKRTLASQMESARLEQTTAEITSDSGEIGLRASGSIVVFPGFLRLYHEDVEDTRPDQEEDERRLPPLQTGTRLEREAVKPEQHFTEPPPRFSEASLVKKLEELGIGRPSTYAQILSVLQDRGYMRIESRRLIPEDKGRLVTAFLENFFQRYVEYDFTADLEDQLDRISAGAIPWTQVLRDFWTAFQAAVKDTEELRIKDVVSALDQALGPHILPALENGGDPRTCPACENGRLGLKLGRFGAFIGCSNYPECRYTRRLGANGMDAQAADAGPKLLGQDPETGLDVTLRRGPYGYYLQRGEPIGKAKPERATLPKDIQPNSVDLALALRLLALPRTLGPHPDSGKPITAGLGRFGPYLEHEGSYVRLASTEEALTVGLNRAVELIANAPKRGQPRGRAETLREIGPHPEDGELIRVLKGRYGPYLNHGRVNAPLPKDRTPEAIDLDTAVRLLAERVVKIGKKGRGAKSAKDARGAKTAKTTKAGVKAARSGAKNRSQSRGNEAKSD